MNGVQSVLNIVNKLTVFFKRRPYFWFILPGFIIYTAFMIFPILYSVYLSFFKWSGIGPMQFVSLENYKTLIFGQRMSKIFFNALGNNLQFLLFGYLVLTPVQLIFAYLIHIKIKGNRYFQLLLFLPYIISTSILGFFAIMVFDPNIGLLNSILKFFELDSMQSAWLGNPNLSFGLFAGVVLWYSLGPGMMIFYSNMKEIPESVMEASLIDGAGELTKFFKVVLPQLIPSLTTNFVLGTIFMLTIFDLPFILGGPGGGVDNTIDFVNMVFYRYAFGGSHFGETSLGFGASISVIMFLLILIVVIIQQIILKRREY